MRATGKNAIEAAKFFEDANKSGDKIRGHHTSYFRNQYGVPRFIRSPKFSYQMALAKGDGSYGKIIGKLSNAHVLVIDDLGLTPMTDPERRDLLEVIEERHGHASTIVTSQFLWITSTSKSAIPPSDAILDRLIHNAHKINLKGGSLRKKYADLT